MVGAGCPTLPRGLVFLNRFHVEDKYRRNLYQFSSGKLFSYTHVNKEMLVQYRTGTMTKVAIFPTLDELRRQLAISEINTGHKIHLFGHGAGPVTDDVEDLHAIADEHGRIQLLSGCEFSMQLYRGQTREYPRCVPTLARLEKTESQFLALCRRVAFEDAIGTHPMVSLAERVKLLGSSLYVDREGLAQHYGLATDMLDVTSNFDVASFFAVCVWNADQRRYQPVCANGKTGVMYRITPVLMTTTELPDKPFGPVHIVGWQPLPRPEQQRAYVVKMELGQDFTSSPSVELFHFLHEKDISHRIWSAFEQGDALFPNDAVAELAQRAELLISFTPGQIERAWQRLMQWTGATYDTNCREHLQANNNISMAAKPCLNWDGLGVETSEERLMNQLMGVLDRVRWRMAAYLT